jgi:hypothetical protein
VSELDNIVTFCQDTKHFDRDNIDLTTIKRAVATLPDFAPASDDLNWQLERVWAIIFHVKSLTSKAVAKAFFDEYYISTKSLSQTDLAEGKSLLVKLGLLKPQAPVRRI